MVCAMTTMTDTSRVNAFLEKNPYARRTPEDIGPLMELADALERVPLGCIGPLLLFDVWMTCTDRANRDPSLSLHNAEVRDAALRVAHLPLDVVRGPGVMLGQDPRVVARFLDTFDANAVLHAYDPRHTNGWDRSTRERALYVTRDWINAGVSLDDAWTVAYALGMGDTTDDYRDRVRDTLLAHRFPVPFVHGIVTGTDKALRDTDAVLDVLHTFRELNAEGAFPAVLVCTALGVDTQRMSDDDWSAWCARNRVDVP